MLETNIAVGDYAGLAANVANVASVANSDAGAAALRTQPETTAKLLRELVAYLGRAAGFIDPSAEAFDLVVGTVETLAGGDVSQIGRAHV
jgi:hypothetical protein